MPFKYANSEIGIAVDVMRGKLSPDELPGIKAAKARRDAEDEEAKSRGVQPQEWREVGGRRLAVPNWVTEAEKRNPGIKYQFIHGFDRLGDRFSQWCEAAPPKPAALASDERWTGKQHSFDYITRTWVENHIPPAPPHIQRVMDMFPEGDIRRPYWNPETRTYGIRDSRPLDTLQDAPVREDLVSPNGFPMTGRSNILKPGEPLPPGYDEDLSPDMARLAASASDGAGSIGPASGTEEGGAA